MTDKPKRKWFWTFLKRCGWGLLALAIVSLVNRFWTIRTAKQRVDQLIAALDVDDPGWRWADIVANRAAVPDNANSGVAVMAATQRLVQGKSQLALGRALAAYEPNRRLSATHFAALTAELDQQAAGLALARPVVDLDRGRYDPTMARVFLHTRIPHIDAVRSVGLFFELEAHAQAEREDATRALAAVRGLLNTGRSIGDEPMLVAQMVRMGKTQTAIRALERVLAQTQPDGTTLQQLAVALHREELELPNALLVAARGERACWFDLVSRLAYGELDVNELAGGGRTIGWQEHAEGWLLVRPWAHQSRERCLIMTTEIVRAAPMIYSLRVIVENQLVAEPKEGPRPREPYPRSQVVEGALKTFANFDRTLALLRCARTSLAIEQHLQKHQRWPTTLDELVPTFLASVPLDPYSRQPLKYHSFAGGVMIYAIGPNPKPEMNMFGIRIMQANPAPNILDIATRLWNPAQRRLPSAGPD